MHIYNTFPLKIQRTLRRHNQTFKLRLELGVAPSVASAIQEVAR